MIISLKQPLELEIDMGKLGIRILAGYTVGIDVTSRGIKSIHEDVYICICSSRNMSLRVMQLLAGLEKQMNTMQKARERS